jgi:hypothetical protein
LSYLVEKGIPIRINSPIFSKFEQSVFPHNNFSVTTEQQHQWIQIVVSDLIKTSYPLNMIHYAACLRRYSDTFEQTPVADLSAQAANDLLPAEVAAFAHNIDRSQLPAVLTHLTKNMSDDHFAKVVCSIIAGAEVATWNNLILHNTDSNICTALWNLALERLSVGSRELNRICSVVLDRWDTIGDVVVTEELFAGIPEDAVFERLQKSEGEFWLQYAKDRFGPNHPQIEEVLKRRAKQMLPDASAR